LITTQQKFESIYRQKATTKAEKDLPSVTAVQNRRVSYLKKALQHIDYCEENEADAMKPVVDKINQLITDIMPIARARKTRRTEPETEPVAETVVAAQ
jgi:hypothetical protein